MAGIPTAMTPGQAAYDFKVEKTGEWKAAKEVMEQLKARCKVAAFKAVRDEAMSFYKQVRQSFTQQNSGLTSWPALTPLTKELRANAGKATPSRRSDLGPPSKGVKALVRTGSLLKSVQIYQPDKMSFFVGVSRKSADKNAIRIAAMHEQGPVVIPITDRMRRFFRYLLAVGVIKKPWPSPRDMFIVIPRRSFLGDNFDKFSKGIEERLQKRLWWYLTEGRIAQVTP